MRLLLPIAALAASVGVHMVHTRMVEHRQEFPQDEDLLYLPPPSHLRLMSVGYREALADLIWVRALVFTGSNVGGERMSWSNNYVNAITHLAPRFHRAYQWGGLTAIYGGQAIVERSMVDRAVSIYRRGLERFPESHELHYTLGMLLLHQVPSTPGYSPLERTHLHKEGTDAIRSAAAFGADPLVRQYAATLITQAASHQMAIQFLEIQLMDAEDEGLRRLLRAKLRELAGSEHSDSVEQLRNEFLAERDATAPYLPDVVWAVIRRDG